MASKLAEMQTCLQNDILNGECHSLSRLSVPEGASPENRLHVYQHAYVARLVEIVSEDYDTTWTFLGDQKFYDLAVAYVRECPSINPNARWFSHSFPEFLEQQPIAADVPVIAEIARIERALGDAFDAADDPTLSVEDLAGIGAENIERTIFGLHPSVTLVALKWNAYDIFNALSDGEHPPEPEKLDEICRIAVWRRDLTCRHMKLDVEEGALLDHVRQGFSFDKLCSISAFMGDPENSATRMAGYLQRWIEFQLLSSV